MHMCGKRMPQASICSIIGRCACRCLEERELEKLRQEIHAAKELLTHCRELVNKLGSLLVEEETGPTTTTTTTTLQEVTTATAKDGTMYQQGCSSHRHKHNCSKWCIKTGGGKGQTVTKRRIPVRVFCNVCDKSFCQNRSLYRHMLIHTGEYPFSCNKCEKKFRQKPHLDRHLRRVHVVT